jgi:cell wall-associated NlpC family hydrolase
MKTTLLLRTIRLSLLIAILGIGTSCNLIRNLTTDPVYEAPTRPSGRMPVTIPAPDTPLVARPDNAAPAALSLREQIAVTAVQYRGIPYKNAGKTPETGFDCSGFTSFVMQQHDIRLSPSARTQYEQGAIKSLEEAQPGDLIFFRQRPQDPISHVALVVYRDAFSLRVVHSTTSRGVIEEDLMKSSYWKPKIDIVRDVLSP